MFGMGGGSIVVNGTQLYIRVRMRKHRKQVYGKWDRNGGESLKHRAYIN